jgi:hypothetical protein
LERFAISTDAHQRAKQENTSIDFD